MKEKYSGIERRKFLRLDYVTVLKCKVCKKKTLSELLKGYTANVSETGLLCNIGERVKPGQMLWLSFDRPVLSICADMEKNSMIYQGGIIGKVVRVQPKRDGTFDVGINFISRQEKNNSHIFPKMYFLEKRAKKAYAKV